MCTAPKKYVSFYPCRCFHLLKYCVEHFIVVMTQKIFCASTAQDQPWIPFFVFLTAEKRSLISFRTTFSLKPYRDLSAFFISNFTKNKRKPDSISLAIVRIDFQYSFIVHLFGSIIYYFRIHTCSSFSPSFLRCSPLRP